MINNLDLFKCNFWPRTVFCFC